MLIFQPACLTAFLRLFFCAFVLSAGSLCQATEKNAVPEGLSKLIELTHEYRLPNGLKLIVREDHRAPVVVSQVWYRVGASYELLNQTGISHALEHMMFKGTERLGPGEFSEWVARFGGQENAFTTSDYTAYYQLWASQYLELSFALEADRMQHLQISQEEFAKEINVVKEERRLRTEDNPNALAYERFQAVAYVSSPYRNPTIGWMRDLEIMSAEELKAWYRRWYAPNNATLVVVGDVKAEHAYQLAERYFGAIPPKNLPKVMPPDEVVPLGERRVTINLPAQLPALYMGFNAPSLLSDQEEWKIYALYMLSGVLDGGYSTRMEKQLVRESKIAASVGAGYSPLSRGDTLFLISGTPANSYTVTDLEQAIWSVLEEIQTKPPLPEELEKVKAQLIAGLIYQQDSISGQANQIGRMESLGLSWRKFPEMIAALDQITPEQVQSVARDVFTKNRLTVAELKPTR